MDWVERFFNAKTPPVGTPERFLDFPEVIEENCIGCKQCEVTCPVEAIEVVKEDGETIPTIDKDRCIRCGLCAETCPTVILETGEIRGERSEASTTGL